ncbi:MAG: hypothetical protein HYR85_17785 [Planctomycetes bacterium]|nr:hypothetical protein [Planctomycetota bacterium]MBI3845185.1 hypothetical protein [Planctomycetota bacterium]
MITDTLTTKQRQAITSDRWHVVQARWSGLPQRNARFSRSIVSEHDTREESVAAGRALASRITFEEADYKPGHRDAVWVRAPHFKSLRFASGRTPRRR